MGFDPVYGARPLKRAIQHMIENPLAKAILEGRFAAKDVIRVVGARQHNLKNLSLEIPRDRQSSFDPQLIAKYQRRFPGFDEKIVSMYARGMSTRPPPMSLTPTSGYSLDLTSAQGGEEPLQLLSNGPTIRHIDVCIVDNDGQPLPEDRVGEIELPAGITLRELENRQALLSRIATR